MADAKPHPLYGVWIDQALASNDPAQMKAALQEARKQYPPVFQPMYGVWINQALQSNASREELQHLLELAKAVKDSNLDAAIQKLEAALAGKK